MKTTLRWLDPEGASIIDAMLFSVEDDASRTKFTEIAEQHHKILDTIHLTCNPPEIVYPNWHITLRERAKPFMVSYPFGLSKAKPYNVRLSMDQGENPLIYEVEVAIRYNIGYGTNHMFRPIILDGYLDAVDFMSVAASTQAIFHSLFKEHTDWLMRYNPECLFNSVSDYSSQNTILPAYNTHNVKAYK